MFSLRSFLSVVLLPFLGLLPVQAQQAQTTPEEFTRLKETLLKDSDPVRQGIAAHDILRKDFPEGLEFLRAILREPKDPQIVEVVLKAFSVAGNYGALEEMLCLVTDDRDRIRKVALSSFAEMPDKGERLSAEIRRIMDSKITDEKIRRAAIVTAGKLGLLDSIVGIANYLDNKKFAKAAKDSIYDITGKKFNDKVSFDEWWETRKEWSRERILKESIESSDARAIELTLLRMKGDLDKHIAALSDSFSEVRKAAAVGIAAMRTDTAIVRAIQPLCQQLKREDDPDVKDAMLNALGAIGAGNGEAREILLKALDSSEPRERRSAVRALSSFASESSVLSIFASIVRAWVEGRRSDEWGFKIDLLQALARAGEPKESSLDLAPLLGRLLLEESDEEVRKSAALALRVYGDADSIQDLAKAMNPSKEKAIYVRYNSASALNEIGMRLKKTELVLPHLHHFLNDPSSQNREQAVRLLGEIKNPASSEVLINLLLTENDRDLRKRIFNSIEKIANPRSLDALLHLELKDGDDREAFFWTLDTLCGKDPAKLLKTAVECSNRNEMRWAVTLLERGLALEGVDPGLIVQMEKAIVPAYRIVARETLNTPNAPAGAGIEILNKAKTRLTHLKQVEPEQLTWALAYADVFLALGQKPQALTAYAELLPKLEQQATDPALLRAGLEPYVDLLLEAKEPNTALPHLVKLVSAIPTDRDLREKLAKLELELNKIAEAVADYEFLRQNTSKENKEEFWRVTAELADLRLEYSNGVNVTQMLKGFPPAGEISTGLNARLQQIAKRAKEMDDFVGPLLDPLVPVTKPEKKN